MFSNLPPPSPPLHKLYAFKVCVGVSACVCEREGEGEPDRGGGEEKGRLLQFSRCLLGMSWLRRSQNDLLGEKKEGNGEKRSKREREMRCHRGIPLSSPAVLSCAVHLIPPPSPLDSSQVLVIFSENFRHSVIPALHGYLGPACGPLL